MKAVTMNLIQSHHPKNQRERKAKWSNSLVDDMIDIVVNNNHYKKRLILFPCTARHKEIT
jgi:hypothetical protein